MDGLVYRGRKLVEVVAAGALAGLLAGTVGLCVLTGWGWTAGLAPLAPVTAIGAAVLGLDAPWWLACWAGAGILAGGLVTFGVAFATFVRSDTSPTVAGVLGVAWGLFAWTLCSWGLAPGALPELSRVPEATPTGWLGSFLVAGAGLGVLPRLQRRLLIAAMPRRPFVLVRGNRVSDSRSAGN